MINDLTKLVIILWVFVSNSVFISVINVDIWNRCSLMFDVVIIDFEAELFFGDFRILSLANPGYRR